jgi:hypothetical protein
MRQAISLAKLLLGAGTALVVVSGSAEAGPLYSLSSLISVPATADNVQPGKTFTSFDISFFDPVTGNDYIADRSNASVDIVSGSSRTVIGQAPGFTGQAPTTSASGPNGVVAVTAGGTTTLFAGDGNSTLKVFNVTNPATPTLLQSISTGGASRVDEMAYSPVTHQVLAANNADSPAFATLFNITSGATPASIGKSGITVPFAGPFDGMEQSVWDSTTGTFFVSIPSFNGDQGGVVEIKTDGTIGRIFKFATMAGGPASCSSTGLALGASGNLMIGCGAKGSQAVLLNPAGNGGAGAIVNLFPQISNTDEIWYDPTTGDFFVTGVNSASDRVFDVIDDASQLILQSVLLPVSALSNPHSIAVDPFTGDVFVPLAGSTPGIENSTCPDGCIAVFATTVPEPGSWSLLIAGLLAFAGYTLRQRFARI